MPKRGTASTGSAKYAASPDLEPVPYMTLSRPLETGACSFSWERPALALSATASLASKGVSWGNGASDQGSSYSKTSS